MAHNSCTQPGKMAMAQSQASMAATKFNISPTLTILDMDSWPLPNTMALGGVAMGNMKAQLLAMVTGTTNNNGSMPHATAT